VKTLGEIDYATLQQCMHCGMCLPTCPTYVATKQERNSPRGRIAWMRAIADGDLTVTAEFGGEMGYCLGCLACTTACPAGVDYATLFEVARSEVEAKGVLDSPGRKAIRWSLLRVLFTRPRLLRAAGRALWFWRASGLQWLSRRSGAVRLLPARIRRLEAQTPVAQARFSHQLIAPVEHPPARPGAAERVRRVVVLTGCVQDLLFADINRATVDVLLANGCEVHTPPLQPCCGSLHAHNGDTATAELLARRQLDLIDPFAFDAIISNAGGCGSHLRHYDHLLEDDAAYRERAAEWSRKLKDISEYLVEIGFRAPKAPAAAAASAMGASADAPAGPLRVTYHESCHLCHGQKVSRQPREVLRAIPGLELQECAEATWCCGSAGVYSITQPDTAQWLQQRKLGHLLATGAPVIASGNPGCTLQIAQGLERAGSAAAVVHPAVLLAQAYRREAAGP
jgi:glycolate oxidase iron-sulfur subunit